MNDDLALRSPPRRKGAPTSRGNSRRSKPRATVGRRCVRCVVQHVAVFDLSNIERAPSGTYCRSLESGGSSH
eukprot:SAG22_NODE_19855_length_271_cov_0.593023_1_plen_71_part_10